MTLRLRFALGLLLAVASVLVSRVSRAAMMNHYDLTSLALEADLIVRAESIAERRVDTYTTVHTLRVTNSYAGDLRPGDTFDISYDLYNMVPFGQAWGAPDAGHPARGKDLVLFLVRVTPDRFSTPGQPYQLVSSGLRIFLDGKAQRFEQWNNPGGFEPVPQGHDPFDLFGDPRGGAGLDLPGLEAEISHAIARAKEVRDALAAPDSPAARRHMIDLCGPPGGAASIASTTFGGFYANSAARRLVEALARTGDLPATLEGYARSYGVEAFGLNIPFAVDKLLDAAANPRLPLGSRLAAIGLASAKWYDLYKMADGEARVTSLLDDPAPEIRAAAAGIHTSEQPSQKWKAAILERWRVETDDRVRMVILADAETAHVNLPPALSPRPTPVVAVMRTLDVVTIQWADPDRSVNLMAKSAVLTAKWAGGERTRDLVRDAAHYSNGATGHLTARMVFTPPLPPGDVELELTVVLEELAGKRPDAVRMISLGTIKGDLFALPASSASPSAASAASASSAASAAPSSAAPIATAPQPSSVPPPRSACGCELGAPPPRAAPWLDALGLAALGARRRRRGTRHSTPLAENPGPRLAGRQRWCAGIRDSLTFCRSIGLDRGQE